MGDIANNRYTFRLIPNCIMKAKSERKRLFIGNQIEDCRDLSGLYYLLPCERGYITKWDVQKPIWDYVFQNYPIHDEPLIMTQPIYNFRTIQECVDEIFFEEYEVKSMLRINPTDLAKCEYVYKKGNLFACLSLFVLILMLGNCVFRFRCILHNHRFWVQLHPYSTLY